MTYTLSYLCLAKIIIWKPICFMQKARGCRFAAVAADRRPEALRTAVKDQALSQALPSFRYRLGWAWTF